MLALMGRKHICVIGITESRDVDSHVSGTLYTGSHGQVTLLHRGHFGVFGN